MSENPKRVALFEDYEGIITSLKMLLPPEGYEIVSITKVMIEAMKIASQLNKLDVLVALVDGNLTKGERGNWEGALITGTIHEKSPGVVVVGYPSDGIVSGADYNVEKSEGPRALLEVLAQINR